MARFGRQLLNPGAKKDEGMLTKKTNHWKHSSQALKIHLVITITDFVQRIILVANIYEVNKY